MTGLVCDNYATHKTGEVRRWPVRHPLGPVLKRVRDSEDGMNNYDYGIEG